MNASIRGVLFVKADRIMERVRKARTIITGNVTHETLDDFVKTIEVIVNNELTDKGVEKKWKN